MRASLSIESLSASSTSMLVRLRVSLRVIAFEIALIDEARADAGRGLRPATSARSRVDFVLGEALDAFARVDAQLLRQVQTLALGLEQPREDRRTPPPACSTCGSRCTSRNAGARRDQLLIDARLSRKDSV